MLGSGSKTDIIAAFWCIGFAALIVALPPSLTIAQTSSLADAGVITMARQEVPRSYSLPSRAVAYQQVRFRPRVNGVIMKIICDPTVPLVVGDPMFQLDDASYVAAVASAEAEFAIVEAEVSVAKAAYDKAVGLKGSGFTEVHVEQAKATLETSQARLKPTKAALDFSRHLAAD